MSIFDAPLTDEVLGGDCFRDLTVEEAFFLRGSLHGICATPLRFLGLVDVVCSSVSADGVLTLWSLEHGAVGPEDVPFMAFLDEVVVAGAWKAKREQESNRWTKQGGLTAPGVDVVALIERHRAHDAFKNRRTAKRHFESWHEDKNASAKPNN